MTERERECVKAYRIAALSISALLLVALVALIVNADDGNSPATTTTTVAITEASTPITSTTSTATTTVTASPTVGATPDDLNDRLVSTEERDADPTLARLPPASLATLAAVVCDAVEQSTDKATVYDTVHERLQRTRSNMTAETAARLAEAVARVACLEAFEQLR